MSTYRRQVIIMRGLPGSRKSSLARAHKERLETEEVLDAPVVIVSADDYFLDATGRYVFDITKIAQAHAACLLKFVAALRDNTPVVIVDNTFIQTWEYAHYIAVAAMAGYEVNIVETHPHPDDLTGRMIREFAEANVHGVPASVIAAMALRWETKPPSIPAANLAASACDEGGLGPAPSHASSAPFATVTVHTKVSL